MRNKERFNRIDTVPCPKCGNRNNIVLLNPMNERKIICWDCDKIFTMEKHNPQDIKSNSGLKTRNNPNDSITP